MRSSKPNAFTLVELLVVIGIIAILVALLLPAVQAAREAARRAQCTNNVKQFALGCIAHESAHGHFPTGGWGGHWSGDPDRGVGREQPGGWMYNVLPYVEQAALHALPGDGQPEVFTYEQSRKTIELVLTPLPNGFCPSRRSTGVQDSAAGQGVYSYSHSARPPERFSSWRPLAISDYVINAGHDGYLDKDVEPFVLKDGKTCPNFVDEVGNQLYGPHVGSGSGCDWPLQPLIDEYIQPILSGVSFTRSLVGSRHLEDGASGTYLVGEKASHYHSDGIADPNAWSAAFGSLQYRSGLYPPQQDFQSHPDHDYDRYQRSWGGFGGAHLGGAVMSYCDGHVRTVSFDVDDSVHRHAAHRGDGGRPLRVDEPSEVMFPDFNSHEERKRIEGGQ